VLLRQGIGDPVQLRSRFTGRALRIAHFFPREPRVSLTTAIALNSSFE
jgi:hypothetical protein